MDIAKKRYHESIHDVISHKRMRSILSHEQLMIRLTKLKALTRIIYYKLKVADNECDHAEIAYLRERYTTILLEIPIEHRP